MLLAISMAEADVKDFHLDIFEEFVVDYVIKDIFERAAWEVVFGVFES